MVGRIRENVDIVTEKMVVERYEKQRLYANGKEFHLVDCDIFHDTKIELVSVRARELKSGDVIIANYTNSSKTFKGILDFIKL